MKPIDRLGFGPKREEKQLEDGRWEIKVTPPSITGFSSSTVILTRDQFIGYNRWRVEGVLIQDALPDLTPAQREILITGIGPEEWDETFKDDDKDDEPTF